MSDAVSLSRQPHFVLPRVCVRACVRVCVCVRECVRACVPVHACVRACVRAVRTFVRDTIIESSDKYVFTCSLKCSFLLTKYGRPYNMNQEP